MQHRCSCLARLCLVYMQWPYKWVFASFVELVSSNVRRQSTRQCCLCCSCLALHIFWTIFSPCLFLRWTWHHSVRMLLMESPLVLQWSRFQDCLYDVQDSAMSVIPHVEASLMATDITGLTLLQRAGCFRCHDTWRKAKVRRYMSSSILCMKCCKVLVKLIH